MNIPITLNGNKIILDSRPEESLMSVLRKKNCQSVKCGCNGGSCGSCTVLMNDSPVASCRIPVGIIRDNDIVTLDYFAGTKEYTAITQGFELAGIKLCGYCDAGKIFLTYQILKSNKLFTKQEIINQVKGLAPCCTDLNTLCKGIMLAVETYNKGYDVVVKKYRINQKNTKTGSQDNK
ncbi:MAG: 2Fe-2S iron-sulfur cluster-binding protein [Treponema sp.]|nr:2Fe-2S iron-sulfur cluster-binding protein [Treponema sp.]